MPHVYDGTLNDGFCADCNQPRHAAVHQGGRDDALPVPPAGPAATSERGVDVSAVRPPDPATVAAAAADALGSDEEAWVTAWHRSVQLQRALRRTARPRDGTNHYE